MINVFNSVLETAQDPNQIPANFRQEILNLSLVAAALSYYHGYVQLALCLDSALIFKKCKVNIVTGLGQCSGSADSLTLCFAG